MRVHLEGLVLEIRLEGGLQYFKARFHQTSQLEMAQQGFFGRAIRHQLDLEEVLVVEKEHVRMKDVAPINLAKIKLQSCL